MSDPSSLLAALRSQLARSELNGFLIPMADEFQSELVPDCARRIAMMTGFTGSAAFVVVLADKAAFFTDSRYTLQASMQVDTSLYEIHDSAKLSAADWLAEHAAPNARIGFDPWLHTQSSLQGMEKKLGQTGIDLVPLRCNPVDKIWPEKPAAPMEPILAYDIAYAGQSSADKRKAMATALQKSDCEAYILTDPASIAWLLNVRGGDVPYSPLPLSYAILYRDGRVTWYVATEKVTKGLDAVLGNDIARHRISDFPEELVRLGTLQGTIQYDPAITPFAIVHILHKAKAKCEAAPNPCLLPKACKNETEIEGMRAAHRRDGAAVVKFLAWLDSAASDGATELQAEAELERFRAQNQHFRGPSFETIAGFGPHGAIVHYRATQETSSVLQRNGLLLVDSGGQYLDGTTDITRTVPRGTPSDEMKDRYTRVLKGHLALSMIRFPEGTTGADLDALARQHLWAIGLDYGHGTGHGVGSYLCVHEGPQGISKRNRCPLRPGMVLSNEPGYYKEGAYGIRIENLMLVTEISDYASEGRKTLCFETLTLAPYNSALIDVTLLSPAEKSWIDAYHERVKNTLRPQLDPASAAWLEMATRPLA